MATVIPFERPNAKNVKVRQKAEHYRPRCYLTPAEIERLLKAAKGGRHSHRDYTLVLICYRHGLRGGELSRLLWSDVDFAAATLNCRRLKRGINSVHPVAGDELRALRKLRRETEGAHVFASERGSPLSVPAIRHLVKSAGERAAMSFPITTHVLRHSCGYALANKRVPTRHLQHYLGHANPANTARYTALASDAFSGFWADK